MMTRLPAVSPGQILTGSLFNEPMRVETVQTNGPASWVVGLVGTQSERFLKGQDIRDQFGVLGELLRDTSDHLLLLTATPHKGDPENFSLFLQFLDADCYADVKSIREAMDRKRAPFYLRRTKDAGA